MEGIAQSVPFVIEQELVEQYGDTFLVTLDENTMPVVEAVHTTL